MGSFSCRSVGVITWDGYDDEGKRLFTYSGDEEGPCLGKKGRGMSSASDACPCCSLDDTRK